MSSIRLDRIWGPISSESDKPPIELTFWGNQLTTKVLDRMGYLNGVFTRSRTRDVLTKKAPELRRR